MSRRATGRSRKVAALVFLIFIAIALLTNILGPIIPDVIHSFSLSLTAAALLPFSFFIAYGVMSIPAGMLVERSGEKPVILAAWVLSLVGSLLVASVPGYRSALVSVFLIGVAMAVLQGAVVVRRSVVFEPAGVLLRGRGVGTSGTEARVAGAAGRADAGQLAVGFNVLAVRGTVARDAGGGGAVPFSGD
jgi:MFS family permease